MRSAPAFQSDPGQATPKRSFSFAQASAPARDLVRELQRFSFNGAPTRTELRGGIPFLFNEFWTAKQRQAHRIHEISYRACFKPQLPEFFIARLTTPGEGVYDPFMGRGTTAIQAAIMGRRPLGADINPLSPMLVRPRLNAPRQLQVAARLAHIDWRHDSEMREDLLVFYHRETLRQIHALQRWFAQRMAAGAFDAVDDWIRMIALNRLTGHSPGFFSVYTLPPNQAVSCHAQRKINAKRNQAPPLRDVAALIARKSARLLAGPPFQAGDAILTTASSASARAIPDGSAALAVTSPPFLDVVDYAQDNWLRCWFADIDVDAVRLSVCRDPADWCAFVRAAFVDLARIVRPGGHVAFEVGDVRKGAVELDKLALEQLAGLPFAPLAVAVNVQEFTKTAHCWGVDNNRKGANTNRIVLARRH